MMQGDTSGWVFDPLPSRTTVIGIDRIKKHDESMTAAERNRQYSRYTLRCKHAQREQNRRQWHAVEGFNWVDPAMIVQAPGSSYMNTS
jgi:hypothetical protein